MSADFLFIATVWYFCIGLFAGVEGHRPSPKGLARSAQRPVLGFLFRFIFWPVWAIFLRRS